MQLLSSPTFILFVILVFGHLLGSLRLRGFSLGTLGVLIVALIFGHFGLQVDEAIFELGLLLFVYAVGLQAGPRFFRTLQRSGSQCFVLAGVPILLSLIATLGLMRLFHWSIEQAVGVFSGALTNTSALAAAVDVMNAEGTASARADASFSYGLVYPFSMLLVVLVMQFLPRFLKVDLTAEDEEWKTQRRHIEPDVVVRHLEVSNPNCDGRTIRELNARKHNHLNISLVTRNGETLLAEPDLALRLGDIITVIVQESDLVMTRLLIGNEVKVQLNLSRELSVDDVEITESSLIGRSLGELQVFERYRVIVTRVTRQGLTFVAEGTTELEMGDQLRIAGKKEHVEAFAALSGASPHLAQETNMLPFLAGLLLGVIVGSIPISIAGSTIKLGIAGGAFFVSVIIGHFGHIGSVSMYVPQAAKNLCRELGLMLFLAAAGTFQGTGLIALLIDDGLGLFSGGIIIAAISVGTTFLLSRLVYGDNILATMGYICGTMNNAAGFTSVRGSSKSDLPGLSYTTIFPISLILKIILAQLLVFSSALL